jgi:two-component system, chemotaxis family, chemotaxis protein CheY
MNAMINVGSELAEDYLAECLDHLATIEADLLAIEEGGAVIDQELVTRIFRSVHWVEGGAGVFDLVKIGELARQTENALAPIRSGNTILTPERVRILLQATDSLRDLIRNPETSNEADIGELLSALNGLSADQAPAAKAATDRTPQGRKSPRMLLVEDDFASRLLLQTFLSRFGECHVAVNGWEAVEAVRIALDKGQRYDMICMDIMMPVMDGRQAVRQVRAAEEEHGILSTYGTKIIMTTAVEDVKEVVQCFKELCDAYLTKPIDLAQLLGHLKSFQLIR